MAAAGTPPLPGRPFALGALLGDAVAGVVQAQRRLDDDALHRAGVFAQAPQGTLVLPPLWYTFSDVQVQLEVATVASELKSGGGVQLACQLLNPTAVSLFGHAAASGLRVSLRLAPRDAVPASPRPEPPAPPPADPPAVPG
jgi:hypothetical protein